jgi:hypothetical protein
VRYPHCGEVFNVKQFSASWTIIAASPQRPASPLFQKTRSPKHKATEKIVCQTGIFIRRGGKAARFLRNYGSILPEFFVDIAARFLYT